MAKDVKMRGKTRKLKRSVRKTLGALFLASALVVAAIPTEGLEAASSNADNTNWGTLATNWAGNDFGVDAGSIPVVPQSANIYTSGDGLFRFAYVRPAGEVDGAAVILGYNKNRTIPDGALTIPNTVDAYMKFTDNLGTNDGRAAVGKSGEFLYYKVDHWTTTSTQPTGYKPERVEVTKYDNTVDPPVPIEWRGNNPTFHVCYYSDRANWEKLDISDFYYYANNVVTAAEPLPTTSNEHQRIMNAAVRYIGNQTLIANLDASGNEDGTWRVGATVDYNTRTSGIFAQVPNLRTLKVGSELVGIGDYAFYGCSALDSITLQNGLNTIGVGAFADCANIKNVDIDMIAGVAIIGDYAFYNCSALQSFTVPIAVRIIGNSAFEGCINLKTIETNGNIADESVNILLGEIGKRAFKGCESLQSFTIPRSLVKQVTIGAFEGCSSLGYIEAPNNMNVDFSEDVSGYTFENFKAQVPATFYFKGAKDSALHRTATEKEIPFSFFDQDINDDVYEKTVREADGKKAVYRVDSKDNLVYCHLDVGMTTVTLPETIGPHKLISIGSDTFQHNCMLQTITIPASITSIAENAFRGCHQLKTVFFTDPANLVSIGSGAFKTQQDVRHMNEGTGGNNCTVTTLPVDPKLYFVGPISNETGVVTPFSYAMDPGENINSATGQNETYITYYTGLPSNLEVRYNPDTDKNELVEYPTIADYQGTKYNVNDYPYMTQEDINNMQTAANKYAADPDSYPGSFQDDERRVVDSALNIVLPNGIESVKQGLFREKESNESAIPAEQLQKTLTAYSLKEVEDETFDGCKYLNSITLSDATEKIGNYAFKDCENLTNVSLPATVSQMGVRPFVGCKKLTNVNFNGSPYFTCDNSIIYELSNNYKDKIVQCLEARSDAMITANETTGITGIYPEAFMYAENVLSIDLSSSTVDTIPEYAFAYTPNLAILTLPRVDTFTSIKANAFKNSAVQNLKVPGKFHQLDEKAFGDGEYKQPGEDGYSDKNRDDIGGRGPAHHETVIESPFQLVCEEGSQIEEWARQHGVNYTNAEAEVYYKVTFYDWNQKVIDPEGLVDALGRPWTNPQTVKMGESALEPVNLPVREGWKFTGWTPNTWQVVMKDQDVFWTGEPDDPAEKYWKVTFYDEDMSTVIATQEVKNGGEALSPQVPTKPGKTFQGWRRVGSGVFDLKNITEDIDLFAYYLSDGENPGGSPGTSGSPNPSGSPGTSGSPNPSGSPGTSGSPNPSGSPGTSGSPNPSGSPGSKLYVLTVQNGSGSGNYAEGAQPIIIANNPARGQEFSHWTISPSDTKIASTVLSATVITMPGKDVTVTAHYKASSSSSSGTGSGNTSSSNRPPTNVSKDEVTNGGTTVVIDKNGLSNTGVVSATVNGSSDNFTIKITESSAATEAVLRALLAEYGNIENIKYFPMDISLYDSTGTNKITDTTGLSVSITLPLPDSLKAYAGNNKVAGVVNDRLDKLTPKFTTISGVPCITFTAEHFSPYVIYADISNLSTGGADDTPKTGDGIHPKWFLSIGLACVSLVLFMKRDSRKQRRVRTA